jgi:hypothetical protein
MQLPIPPLNYSTRDDQQMVWDLVRRKWVVLTPEEMVRQSMIHYLNHHLSYPISWMVVEKQITVNGLKKRFDILVYDPASTPKIMVECKAPDVALSKATFDQIARYNLTMSVPLLVITNGHEIYCAKINVENQLITWLNSIPAQGQSL